MTTYTPSSGISVIPGMRLSRPEFRLLDAHGCLTLEAMCFVDELVAEQRAVVRRHIQACSLCAQHQTRLSQMAERVRRARPVLGLPVEARVVGRQVLTEALVTQRDALTAARMRVYARRRRRLRQLLGAALVATLAAVIGLLAARLFS